jgi:hypothetical protein
VFGSQKPSNGVQKNVERGKPLTKGKALSEMIVDVIDLTDL